MFAKPRRAATANGGLYLLCGVAVGLWAAFSLPAILLSGMFPMDMHFFYAIGSQFQAWLPWILWPETWSGRYFPVYWLFYAAEFAVFGTFIGGYLAVQSVVLAAGSGLAAFLVAATTKSYRLAALAVILWFLNTPIAENISTVGKSEPIACVLILAALVLFYRFVLNAHGRRRELGRAWPALVGSGLLVLLAVWTKETSIVALGVALTGLVLSLALSVLCKRREIRAHASSYVQLVCALLIAIAASQLHYLHEGVPPPGSAAAGDGAGGYVTFHMTIWLVLNNIAWYIRQQPDVFAFCLAALALLAIVGRDIWRNRLNADACAIHDYIFMASIYSAAAVYYFAMWFWRWPMGYYMLFPSVVFKICFLYGSHAAGFWDKARTLTRPALVAFIGLAATYAALYCFYIISSQVAYSRIYSDALTRMLQMPGTDKTLIVESYPFYSEQVDATQVLLRYMTAHRGDGQSIAVNGILDTIDPYVVDTDRPGNGELMRMLGVTKEKLEQNFQKLPKKGDYLLAFTGGELATWFLRGVSPYYSEDSYLQQQGAYDMRLVAEHTETIPGLYVNLWTSRPACEKRWLGYKLYQVLDDRPMFLWRGRYPDGWTESASSLAVNPSYGRPVVIKFSAPKASLPMKMTISRDGEFLQDYEISTTDEQTLDLSDRVDKPVKFDFVLDHIVRPAKLLAGQDPRPTGVLMRLATMPAPQPPKGLASCLSP